MVTRTSQYRTGAATAVSWSMAVFLLLLLRDRPADAYIDPGTGGAMFSSLAPILAMIGMLAVAALGFARRYVMWALGFIWRLRWVVVALAVMIAVALAAVYFILAFPRASLPEGEDSTQQVRAEVKAPEAKKDEVDLFLERHADDIRAAEPFHLFGPQDAPDIRRGKYELDYVSRSCFTFEQSGSAEKSVAVQDGQSLLFYVGADFDDGADPSARISFELYAQTDKGEKELAHSAWTAGRNSTRWRMIKADLSSYAGAPLSLKWKVVVPDRCGVCLVSDPRLISHQNDPRTNVILCTIETTRRDHMSLYGYKRKTTPFFEELAKEAMVFDDAYSQSSWTRPSMASVLSGLYPSQHGAHIMFDRLNDSAVLISEMLRARGYATGAFCAARAISDPIFNYDQGFDRFSDQHPVCFDDMRKDVLQWLDDESPDPFFLFMHVLEPHSPYCAPPGYREKFSGAYRGQLKNKRMLKRKTLKDMALSKADVAYVADRYDAEIFYVDTIWRRLKEDLQKRGLWDDALVLISSDHGEELYEHGYWGHQHDLFIEKLAVPLLIKLPGGKHGGIRVGGLASGIDIVPTLLSALGLEVPYYLPGKDIIGPAVETGNTGRKQHLAELWPDILSRTQRVHYALISETSEYVAEYDKGVNAPADQFLFELGPDPHAQRNLIESRPETASELEGAVERRIKPFSWTIVANGGGNGAHVFAGAIKCSNPIRETLKRHLEEGDVVTLSDDLRTMEFKLSVSGDDDILRFVTDPIASKATINATLDGDPLPTQLLRLGPFAESPGELPLEIPDHRCLVDADIIRARRYEVGADLGLFIWRVGVPKPKEERDVNPDEDALRSLKDLGYL
ncbi:MAG: sulfatase-like hydrolase/transferase [Planctomycetes bacterium]|nr:sulfatase-like hydrolase/transferase [Planctomycetota bacterium]